MRLEAAGEPYAGEWGPYPNRDAYITAQALGQAAIDHLRGYAALLVSEGVVLALSTVSRGMLEPAARGAHLLDPAITSERRIVRYMNDRLTGAYERNKMPGARSGAAAQHERILRTAATVGFPTRQGPGKRMYLDPLPLSTTDLVDRILGTDLGQAHWRALCSVAHSQMHGISSRFGAIVPEVTDRETADGVAQVEVSIRAAVTDVAGGLIALQVLLNRFRQLYGLPQEASREEVVLREVTARLMML